MRTGSEPSGAVRSSWIWNRLICVFIAGSLLGENGACLTLRKCRRMRPPFKGAARGGAPRFGRAIGRCVQGVAAPAVATAIRISSRPSANGPADDPLGPRADPLGRRARGRRRSARTVGSGRGAPAGMAGDHLGRAAGAAPARSSCRSRRSGAATAGGSTTLKPRRSARSSIASSAVCDARRSRGPLRLRPRRARCGGPRADRRAPASARAAGGGGAGATRDGSKRGAGASSTARGRGMRVNSSSPPQSAIRRLVLVVVKRRGEAAGVVWHDGCRPLPLLAGLADGLALESSATR